MAAILYRSLTIDRLWALLEAHSGFADLVATARRVHDTEEGWLKRLVLRSVGDFPHVQIEMGDNFSGGPIPIDTFASEPGGFGDGASDYWDEQRASEFKISVMYEKPGFDKQDELEMELIAGIESGGRNLGYAPIVKWGPWKARRNGTFVLPGDAEGTPRPVTQFTIPVIYEFTGAELKPS